VSQFAEQNKGKTLLDLANEADAEQETEMKAFFEAHPELTLESLGGIPEDDDDGSGGEEEESNA